MDSSGRVSYRIILFSLLALVVPLVLFPEMFGLQLAGAALIYVLYELVYYGIVAWVYNRETTLLKIAQAAGLCLVFRGALAVAFGLLVTIMYGMHIGVSMTLGLYAYVPTVLLHVVFTPFILKPVVDRILENRRRRVVISETATDTPDMPAAAREHAWDNDSSATAPRRPAPKPAPRREYAPSPARFDQAESKPGATEPNGFEKAVRYIGENGSVSLAAVVDPEGLLMARFSRGDVDAEEWAPTSLVLFQANQEMLKRYDLGDAEKLDFSLDQKRVVITRAGTYSLVVMFERQTDDVVQIRIRQAIDMINKFVAERYGSMSQESREHAYVSGTE